MKKSQIKDLISVNISERILFSYKREKCDNFNNYSMFLDISDKLILGLHEDDFMFNGFEIMRFKDITQVELKNDYYNNIIKKEGLLDTIIIPKIRLDSWQTVFEDLQSLANNLIVEKEDIVKDECEFWIGKILRVYKNSVHIHNFDADGVWDDGYFIIPYSIITSVTFGSRYVDVFSKYLK